MAGLFEAFILLLGIIDPIASLAAFLSLTSKMDDRERLRIAHKAVLVAALVFFIFAIGGQSILSLLGVDIEAFRAAGGIILILLGIQMGLGISFPKEKEEVSEVAVVIGTPMICGPATITTTIILTGDVGIPTTALAGGTVLIITLGVLALSRFLTKIVGRGGLQILSTMMGIITMAWGIQYLLTGLNAFNN
ncbi:MarC family protein [Candidatus Micrarchaeota archaeon]|nr:MarC family protein [Candidatus Micrarchaeota archaeon]